MVISLMAGCQLRVDSCKPQLPSINVHMSSVEGEEALSAQEAAAQPCLAQLAR